MQDNIPDINSHSVLVVEDDEDVREAILQVVRKTADKVYYCGDGKEALEMMTNTKIDLLITDIRMPKMDGVQLLEEISKSDKMQPFTSMVLSGYGDKQNISQALIAGAYDFIEKPVRSETLTSRIHRAFGDVVAKKWMLRIELRCIEMLSEYFNMKATAQIESIGTLERLQSVNTLIELLAMRLANLKNRADSPLK